MKTKLTIEIETPDMMELYDPDGHDDYSEQDKKDYCKEWHDKVVDYFKNFSTWDLECEELNLETHFEEHFNEDGELPNHIIKVKEVLV